VPVVANVGELQDLVVPDVNGYLVEPGNIGRYTERALALLQDEVSWSRLSLAAADAALSQCGLMAVQARWKIYLGQTIARACGASAN
jgi:glycosyltransferase involved in cell wall biosynthesis